jgi:uncharacterized protein YndB with AHSA1/START domain
MLDTATDTVTTHELRFERLLDAPVATVWQYLVDPDLRARWFMGGAIDQRVGGDMQMIMAHGNLSDGDVPTPEKYAPYIGNSWNERIVRIEPPHLLEFTWEDGKAGTVTIELSDIGERTRLTLTHTGLRGRDDAANFGGGWHAHLAVLGKRIAGEAVPNFWDLHAKSEAEINRALG